MTSLRSQSPGVTPLHDPGTAGRQATWTARLQTTPRRRGPAAVRPPAHARPTARVARATSPGCSHPDTSRGWPRPPLGSQPVRARSCRARRGRESRPVRGRASRAAAPSTRSGPGRRPTRHASHRTPMRSAVDRRTGHRPGTAVARSSRDGSTVASCRLLQAPTTSRAGGRAGALPPATAARPCRRSPGRLPADPRSPCMRRATAETCSGARRPRPCGPSTARRSCGSGAVRVRGVPVPTGGCRRSLGPSRPTRGSAHRAPPTAAVPPGWGPTRAHRHH